jgi:hypothetical protein
MTAFYAGLLIWLSGTIYIAWFGLSSRGLHLLVFLFLNLGLWVAVIAAVLVITGCGHYQPPGDDLWRMVH